VAEHLVRQNGFQSEKTFVAQNALDAKSINRAVNYWRANGAKLERFQHKNDISPQNTVIFVSRLEKDNKIDLLILGIEKLKQDKPKSRLVIIGGGSDEGRLKNLVKAKQLDDCVLFPGPIYDEKKLAPWMLSAALFCYPVNIGLSLLHAFAYGLPVVTSDDVKSHNPEIEALIPGVNGLLYHDGDIDDLVAKWADIMDNHRMRAKLSMAAQQRSDRKYTIETMVKGFIDLGRAMVKNG
jgi:glycosyltransferase involved in cell wall biosynthesis